MSDIKQRIDNINTKIQSIKTMSAEIQNFKDTMLAMLKTQNSFGESLKSFMKEIDTKLQALESDLNNSSVINDIKQNLDASKETIKKFNEYTDSLMKELTKSA
jgi:methyl-accepting chemotaxis protein